MLELAKRHNRIVEREYEDRVRWVRDRCRNEDVSRGVLAVAMNEKHLLHSSTHDSEQKALHDTYASSGEIANHRVIA